MNMSTREAIALGKAIVKAVSDADPVGAVRKTGGISYKKTPAGWVKVGGGKKPPKVEAMFGLTADEVRKALDAVKVVMKARQPFEEGHISHRKGGDFIKQGGTWKPYTQGGGAAAKQAPAPSNAPPGEVDPETGMDLAPPNPVDQLLEGRSLGGIAGHDMEGTANKNSEGITNHLKKNGAQRTLEKVQQMFDDEGAGDLFDPDMPLVQVSELMSKLGMEWEDEPEPMESAWTSSGDTDGLEEMTADDFEDNEPDYEEASEEEIDDYESGYSDAIDREEEDFEQDEPDYEESSDEELDDYESQFGEENGWTDKQDPALTGGKTPQGKSFREIAEMEPEDDDEEYMQHYEGSSAGFHAVADAVDAGETDYDALHEVYEEAYFANGGEDHQGWDTDFDYAMGEVMDGSEEPTDTKWDDFDYGAATSQEQEDIANMEANRAAHESEIVDPDVLNRFASSFESHPDETDSDEIDEAAEIVSKLMKEGVVSKVGGFGPDDVDFWDEDGYVIDDSAYVDFADEAYEFLRSEYDKGIKKSQVRKDGLSSGVGAGEAPNSPLVGPGDRKVRKSFNPLTGRYR